MDQPWQALLRPNEPPQKAFVDLSRARRFFSKEKTVKRARRTRPRESRHEADPIHWTTRRIVTRRQTEGGGGHVALLPKINLRWMQLVLLGQLRDRMAPSDRVQGCLGLEAGTKHSSLPSPDFDPSVEAELWPVSHVEAGFSI